MRREGISEQGLTVPPVCRHATAAIHFSAVHNGRAQPTHTHTHNRLTTLCTGLPGCPSCRPTNSVKALNAVDTQRRENHSYQTRSRDCSPPQRGDSTGATKNAGFNAEVQRIARIDPRFIFIFKHRAAKGGSHLYASKISTIMR